jgi:ubiquitin carboxyl-terminal hydrolase 34
VRLPISLAPVQETNGCRTCLKDIPDHLICHLKRFDFDLQTMHRSKINDCFEFPTKLDMKPYTIDHLTSMEAGVETPSDHDHFELVGVLVHTGTAESGHYYSYIRDRLSPAANPNWFEYNDSEVSVFDPSTIPENCYGGSDTVSATGYVLPKSFSAYMLFYQRSSSLRLSRTPSPDIQEDLPIPASLRMEILRENENLIKRHSMFSCDYVMFVKALVDAQYRMPTNTVNNDNNGEEVLLLALRVFEQICSRVKDFAACDELVSSIQALACRDEVCSKAFSRWASDVNVIHALILDNPFQDIRRDFSRMLVTVLDHLRRTDRPLYGISGTPDDDSNSLHSRKQAILYQVCRGFSETWSGLQSSLKPWNDFFGILIDICTWGDDEKDYMLKAGILKKLLEMIVVDYMPPSRRAESKIENFVKIMNKPRVPAARPAELLYLLMTRCSPYLRPCHNEEARDRVRQDVLLPLTRHEDCYFKMHPPRSAPVLAVYLKLLEMPGTVVWMEKLTAEMLGNQAAPAEHEFVEILKNTLLNGISVDPAVHATPYLHCLRAFISATKSQNYATDIIYKVSEEIPTIGMTGGIEHLQFFQQLWDLDGPGKVVRIHILRSISLWAPALVVYHDGNVRDAAEDFLCNLLFDDPQLSLHIIHRAVADLANGLFQFIRAKFPHNRQPLDENTFVSAMGILAKCKEVEKDEEQFNLKLEGAILHVQQALPTANKGTRTQELH